MTHSNGDFHATFLTEKQLAARQNRSVKTIQKERLTGAGIPYRKFGRSIRYALADILEFERKALRTSTSDPGMDALPCIPQAPANSLHGPISKQGDVQ